MFLCHRALAFALSAKSCILRSSLHQWSIEGNGIFASAWFCNKFVGWAVTQINWQGRVRENRRGARRLGNRDRKSERKAKAEGQKKKRGIRTCYCMEQDTSRNSCSLCHITQNACTNWIIAKHSYLLTSWQGRRNMKGQFDDFRISIHPLRSCVAQWLCAYLVFKNVICHVMYKVAYTLKEAYM